MKAKIIEQRQNGKNYGNDKELVSALSVVGTVSGELRKVVTIRCYMGRSASASVVYASIWVHAPGVSCAGHGSAGGYGYHKESAAIDEAITSAGIELYGNQYADEKGMVWEGYPNPEFSEEARDAEYAKSDEAGNAYSWHNPRTLRKLVREDLKKRANISGVGDSAVRCAALAIAKAAGARGKLCVVTH